jgi:glycerophosphoryl diester phosphodiesterase
MNEPFLNPLPIVVAHRGDSKNYPENTLEAFISATNMGIDVIETDVHLSKDGVVVIWHDPTLERNTDGSGLVEDHTLAQLKQLDAAFTFTPDHGATYPFRGKGIRLATLAEALEACPGQRFNVDLKSKTPLIVDAFIEVVRSHQAQDRVLCASFHLRNLRHMRRKCPDILTSLTTLEVLPLLARQKLGLLPHHPHPQSRTLVFQVPVRQWGIEVITPSFIRDFHKIGAIIQVWTINERQEMYRLFKLGVDTIMTDDPAKVIEVAQELGLRGKP